MRKGSSGSDSGGDYDSYDEDFNLFIKKIERDPNRREETSRSAEISDIEKFLKSFKDKDGKYKYFDAINAMPSNRQTSIEISLTDLREWDQKMKKHFVEDMREYEKLGNDDKKKNPPKLPVNMVENLLTEASDFLSNYTDCIIAILSETHGDYAKEFLYKITARIAADADVAEQSILSVSAETVDSFVVISGRIISKDEPHDYLIKKAFRCINCKTVVEMIPPHDLVGVDLLKIKPKKCPACSEKHFIVDHKNSQYIRQQYVKISQQYGMSEAAEIWVDLRGDLVGKFNIADFVRVIGVSKLAELQTNSPVSSVKGMLVMPFIVANNIISIDDRKKNIEITPQFKAQLKEFVEDYDVYKKDSEGKLHNILLDKLVSYFAPEIYGHELLKLVMLATAVSGNEIINKKRTWINVYVIGDFAEAKTDTVMALLDVCPSLYQSAEGVSEVGLGAGMIDDKHLKRKVVGAGLGVSGNQKIKILDELNNIRKPEYLGQLPTMMEKGFFPMSKGGEEPIHLPATGSWVMIANPTFGSYDPYKSLGEQTNVPKPLLSRVDIILVIRKDTDVDRTQKKMDLISAGFTGQNIITPEKDVDFLYKYIKLASEIPVIGEADNWDPEVKKILDTYYLKLDKLSTANEVVVTLRQYGGLWRIVASIVRLLMRNKVTKEDAQFTTELMDKILTRAGIDIVGGTVGMSTLTNISGSEAGARKVIAEMLRMLHRENNSPTHVNKLFEEIHKAYPQKFDDMMLKKALQALNREGQCFESNPDMWKPA